MQFTALTRMHFPQPLQPLGTTKGGGTYTICSIYTFLHCGMSKKLIKIWKNTSIAVLEPGTLDYKSATLVNEPIVTLLNTICAYEAISCDHMGLG